VILRTVGDVTRYINEKAITGIRPMCFRCGQRLIPPLVVWLGADEETTQNVTVIALHPQCAELLGASLVHDGADAQGKKQE
jgi:hypothetical protein